MSKRLTAKIAAVVLAGTALLAVGGVSAMVSQQILAPGDTLQVHCDTALTGSISANDATLACAATPSPTPSPTPTPTPTQSPTPTPAPSLSFPIRAAFYYPWFPEGWNQQGFNPFTRYTPTLGFYDSADGAIIRSHVASMQTGMIQAGIASWWGRGTPTDSRVPALLANAGSTFRWTLYYEQEGSSDPSVAQIDADLDQIATYAVHPAWLRVAGKPVLFVYGGTETCAMTDRWSQANAGRFYLVEKVFPGYRTCAIQPDGWHQYGPAVATDRQKGYSFSISPGFWRPDETAPRLARDPNRWAANVAAMVASGEPWQLIVSWSEWGEGTTIEPAAQYGTTYLDILGGAAPPAPTPTPLPTAAPIPTSTPIPGPTPIPGTDPVIVSAAGPTPIPGTDPVIVSAGDIACDRNSPQFNGGNGSGMNCRQMATSNTVLSINPAAVLPLGDIQYEDGEGDQWPVSYGPSWGRFKAITHPAVGNHEYLYCTTYTSGCTSASPADGTAKAYSDYFGAAAGALDRYFYSFDVGTWHLIALNSDARGAGGLAVGSEQYNWLVADLNAHPNVCTLAYWHHPRFSSGQHGDTTNMAPIYQLLYDRDVDVVLTGHDHNYERTALLNPAGVIDNVRGIRNFVVGTGGRNVRTGTVVPRSYTQAWNDNTFGLLKLTLHPTGYDFSFVPAVGTFTDAGSGSCH